jgi:phosphatidylserine/phosphatidylglycerophosphate/cardiolipin synthase-like enzyme
MWVFAAVASAQAWTPPALQPPSTSTTTEVFYSQVYSYKPAEAMVNPQSIDRKLASFIGGAKKTLDVALYEVHNDNIAGALIAAKQRGVKVRIVSDRMYREKGVQSSPHVCPHYAYLEAAGIPIVYDTKSGYMHNKYLIRDGTCVWTGSFNSVDTEAWKNHNNAIKICSTKLAAIYTGKFNQMFVEKKYGVDKAPNPNRAPIQVGSMSVETCFAPEDNCGRLIVQKLLAAKYRILVMAFSITDFIPRGPEPLSVRKTMPTIRTVLLEKKKAGLDVRALLEYTKLYSSGSLVPDLQASGIPVRGDGNPGILHSKVMIIDGRVTIIGSFNFSGEAENGNDENMVIVTSPSVGQKYEAEYLRIHNLGKNAVPPVSTCNPAKPLDINSALVGDLAGLPGMGGQGASQIKAHRPYHKLDDLVTKGVMTLQKLDSLRTCLTVLPPPPG